MLSNQGPPLVCCFLLGSSVILMPAGPVEHIRGSRVTVQAEHLGRSMTLRNFTYTAQTVTRLRYREVAHSQYYKHASCRNFGRMSKQKYGLGNYRSIMFCQACQGEQCRECATYADFIIAAKPVRPGIERAEILT